MTDWSNSKGEKLTLELLNKYGKNLIIQEAVNQSEYIINKCSLSYVNDVVINEDDKTATIYVTLIPSKIWDVYTKVNKNENRLSV